MLQVGVDLEKINTDDRNSARQREIYLKDHTPRMLAFLLSVGFFGILLAMFFHSNSMKIPSVDIMLGSLGTAWVQMISYYFGSSKGSADKSFLLKK